MPFEVMQWASRRRMLMLVVSSGYVKEGIPGTVAAFLRCRQFAQIARTSSASRPLAETRISRRYNLLRSAGCVATAAVELLAPADSIGEKTLVWNGGGFLVWVFRPGDPPGRRGYGFGL